MAALQILGPPPTRVGPGRHGYIAVYDLKPLFFPLYDLHRYDNSDRCPRYDPKQEAWLIELPDQGPTDPSVQDFLGALKYPFFVPRLSPELAWAPSHHPSYNAFKTVPFKSGPLWALHHQEVLNLCRTTERLVDHYSSWFWKLQPPPLMLPAPPRGEPYDQAKAVAPRIIRDPEHLKGALNTLFAWYVRALGWLIHLRMSLLSSPHVVREHELLKLTKWLDHEADHSWHIGQDLLTQSMAAYDPSRLSPGVVLHSDVSDEMANGFLAQRVLCWDLLKKTTKDVNVSLRLKWSVAGPASGLIHITPPSNGRVIREHQRQVVRVDSQWREWRHDLFYKPESLEMEWRANRGHDRGPGDGSTKSGDFVTRAKAASAQAEALQGVIAPMSNAPAKSASAPPRPPLLPAPPLARPLSPPPSYRLTPPVSIPSPTQRRRNSSRGREGSRSHPSLSEVQPSNSARHAASPEENCAPTEQYGHGPSSLRHSHQSGPSSRSRSPAIRPSHSGASRTRSQTPPDRYQPYALSSQRPESRQLSRASSDASDGRGAALPSSSTSQPLGGPGMNLDPELIRFLAQNSSSVEVNAPGGMLVVFHLGRNVDRPNSTLRSDSQSVPSLAPQLTGGRASQERPEPPHLLPERLQNSPVPPRQLLLLDRLANIGSSGPASSQPPVSSRVALNGAPEESGPTSTSHRPSASTIPSVASAPATSSSRPTTATSLHATPVAAVATPPPEDADMIVVENDTPSGTGAPIEEPASSPPSIPMDVDTTLGRARME